MTRPISEEISAVSCVSAKAATSKPNDIQHSTNKTLSASTTSVAVPRGIPIKHCVSSRIRSSSAKKS